MRIVQFSLILLIFVFPLFRRHHTCDCVSCPAVSEQSGEQLQHVAIPSVPGEVERGMMLDAAEHNTKKLMPEFHETPKIRTITIPSWKPDRTPIDLPTVEPAPKR
jgi:hypothetical protein